MTHAIKRFRHSAGLWGLVWSTVLFSAVACGSDPAAGPNSAGPTADDTPPPPDSVSTTDSLAPVDSLTLDSAGTSGTGSPLLTGVPYGPYHLMNSYTTYAWGPAPFTASLNGNTGPGGVIRQIDAARAAGQKLMLSLSDGFRSLYMTNGKFDMAKFKARMDSYNTTAIKAAVARGVSDGTIVGNQVINEPNVKGWGGVINKAVVDEMCGYVKKVFPTLPAGPVVVHWWRPSEQYRVCDFIISQYDWYQPPMGNGPWGRGDVVSWRNAALAQAKKEGIAIAFSMNIMGGGTRIEGCPVPATGGRYASGSNLCRMTSDQVRQYGRALGPSGCAMFMWKYEAAFWSKPANVGAFKDVAATLRASPGRSCRRPG